ncbi:MAG: histidine phosphatase family protein [Sedimentitalea sp.]|uniref:histidine phosphatase family protein n=1 Tax=Sedimentitalea sp. TaxID=2048915 RepID=UPI00326769E0
MTDRYIALIRHGAYHQQRETPSALQPYPLTQTGRAQASQCGAEIADILLRHRWSLDPVAHCSTELRAWQTAQVARDELSRSGHEIETTQTPLLSERSVGSAANLTVHQIEQALADDPRYPNPPEGWKSNSEYSLPYHGAESLMMAGARVAVYLRSVIEKRSQASTPQLTLFFGHGASFRHAAFNLGVLAREEIAQLSMYHARPLFLCYNRSSQWEHFGGDWKHRSRSSLETD